MPKFSQGELIDIDPETDEEEPPANYDPWRRRPFWRAAPAPPWNRPARRKASGTASTEDEWPVPPVQDWVVRPMTRNEAAKIVHQGEPLRASHQMSVLLAVSQGWSRCIGMLDPQTYIITESDGQEYSVKVLTGAAANFWDHLITRKVPDSARTPEHQQWRAFRVAKSISGWDLSLDDPKNVPLTRAEEREFIVGVETGTFRASSVNLAGRMFAFVDDEEDEYRYVIADTPEAAGYWHSLIRIGHQAAADAYKRDAARQRQKYASASPVEDADLTVTADDKSAVTVDLTESQQRARR